MVGEGRRAKGWTGERDGPSRKTTKVVDERGAPPRSATETSLRRPSDRFMGFNRGDDDFCVIRLSVSHFV